MMTFGEKKRANLSCRILSFFVVFSFMLSLIVPLTPGYAKVTSLTLLGLPEPGARVSLTSEFNPVIIRGITIHPENPLEFDFIIHNGDSALKGNDPQLKKESERLIKYFLATLTVPENDLWVNLSPYENDRIIPNDFGATEMGRDLLAQDYILKQLTASLLHPEEDLGKKFWDKVYKKAYQKYGTTKIPINTFNKVWIVADSGAIYESGNTALVVDTHLKVMLEEDYLALKHHLNSEKMGTNKLADEDVKIVSSVSSEIVREIIIPAIEKEVNEGKNFAQIRQIYNSLVLAAWYKKALRKSLLGQIYVDKSKTAGIEVADKQINKKIYNQYVKAFKKGVFNYIRKDYDRASAKFIRRKYFSGGAVFSNVNPPVYNDRNPAPARIILELGAFSSDIAKGGKVFSVNTNLTENGAGNLVVAPLRAQLQDIAARMVPANGGILAADESTGSAGKRLDMVGLENNAENRQKMRELMLTSPGLEKAGVNAVILYDETFDNVDSQGRNLVQHHLLGRGILPGIKTDRGLIDDPDSPGEKLPNEKGLQMLPELLQTYAAKGAVFTKWRVTIAIDTEKNLPTEANIRKNAQVLAKSAKQTQLAGLVPVVEPEVLLNGAHDIAASYRATTLALEILYEELAKEDVWLEGVILKTSMILSGDKAKNRADSDNVGYQTLKGMLKTVPVQVPAVVFLSGGQEDAEVNENLDAVIRASQNRFESARDAAAAELLAEGKTARAQEVQALKEVPWELSYSFGRGLQRPALAAWEGKDSNFQKAQSTMLQTALEVQSARLGKLKNTDYTQTAAFSQRSSDAKYGGIDLTLSNLELQIKRDGDGVPLPVDFQNIKNINVNIRGLFPNINHITPVTSPLIIGISEEKIAGEEFSSLR